MAAGLNWVIKDGLGQFGGVIFASLVSTKFDSNPRYWRMVSSLSLDAACALELMSPMMPTLFIPVAALANVAKNISWLAASASRAAIHNTFATSSNLADITAKTGSQNIAASLAGTSLGIAIASSFIDNHWGLHAIAAFGALSAVHLTAVYMSLRSTHVNTFNKERLALFIDMYLNQKDGPGLPLPPAPSPAEVSHYEHFLPLPVAKSDAFTSGGADTEGEGSAPCANWLRVGAPFHEVYCNTTELRDAWVASGERNYALAVREAIGGDSVEVDLHLLEEASVRDTLEACVHMNLVRRDLLGKGFAVNQGDRVGLSGEAVETAPLLHDMVGARRLDAAGITEELMGALAGQQQQQQQRRGSRAGSAWRMDVLQLEHDAERRLRMGGREGRFPVGGKEGAGGAGGAGARGVE